MLLVLPPALATACSPSRSPHVNIISGSNGSGKSAVLQAMQAALGAKAKDTGRGDNFRELVRTGCHEAKVEVGGGEIGLLELVCGGGRGFFKA
jgi:recombinational DNA repair ATPase RecF